MLTIESSLFWTYLYFKPIYNKTIKLRKEEELIEIERKKEEKEKMWMLCYFGRMMSKEVILLLSKENEDWT